MKKISQLKNISIILIIAISYLFTNCQNAEKVNLENVTIVINDDGYYDYQKTVAEVLTGEVNKRTGFLWTVSPKPSNDKHTITLSIDKSLLLKPESYHLKIEMQDDKYKIEISSSDKRGLLYGAGKFLRMLEWEKGFVLIPSEADITSSPQYPVRGHQLGYRNRANSWDAWTPEQFDQYIRELAIFGANSIENIPFEDNTISPHMLLPREEMNIKLSQICAKYDLDYWMWTPADFDLNDNKKREAALKKHEELFKDCPEVSAIFFPGGDPGHNEALLLFPYLEEIARLLNKYHPKAKVWMSMQGFGSEDINYVYKYIESEKPEWFGGLVSGPGSRSVERTRERLLDNYKLRHYPDITHTVRCQYSAEWYDQAYELTLGREPVNPQPNFYADVFKKTAHFTDGSVSYSDGVHDDVNKVVYLELGWDPNIDVKEIVSDYTRLFFGAKAAQNAAEGIFSFEQNWIGPLKDNVVVEKTFDLWSKLEKENPQLANNWRWQMNLLRANYDCYTRRRLIYEESLEKEANDILRDVNEIGINKGVDSALITINRNFTNPIDKKIRIKIEDLCDNLFQSIGLQTSVEKYQASGLERGCVLDYVDAPLNNREWLQYELVKVREMNSKSEQMSRLKVISNWENPGIGSYYDNIGKISQSGHVDKNQLKTPSYGWFGKKDGPPRLSTKVSIERPNMNYNNLDPDADYMLRVAGYGDALLKINGNRINPTLYNKGYEEFKEFIVPKGSYKDGTIDITWDRPDERHLNWRNQSFISDVWLLKLK